ncbi:MAG: transposase [Patescibacteria group bacterium]|nr:transposase [Patescibacteria group bacterium]
MPYRATPFVNDCFYHVYNRGVEKRQIFLIERDYQRFLQTLYYYQFIGPKPRYSTRLRFKNKEFDKNPKIVEIVCYCLMPNHFHLLLKQLKAGGIQEFLSKTINSYTKYFNTKHRRIGHLFQGQFKAVSVETDEQLLHLSRYIHLNPYVAGITKEWKDFSYSSIQEFIGNAVFPICETRYILDFFGKLNNYESFVTDYQSYALELGRIKHQLIDIDED